MDARPKRARKPTQRGAEFEEHCGKQFARNKKKNRAQAKPTLEDINITLTRVNVMLGGKEMPWSKLAKELGLHPGRLSEMKTGHWPENENAGRYLDALNKWVANNDGAQVTKVWCHHRDSPSNTKRARATKNVAEMPQPCKKHKGHKSVTLFHIHPSVRQLIANIFICVMVGIIVYNDPLILTQDANEVEDDGQLKRQKPMGKTHAYNIVAKVLDCGSPQSSKASTMNMRSLCKVVV